MLVLVLSRFMACLMVMTAVFFRLYARESLQTRLSKHLTMITSC